MQKHFPRLALQGDDAPNLELEALLNRLISDLCPHCVSEREQRFRRAQRWSRPNGNLPDN